MFKKQQQQQQQQQHEHGVWLMVIGMNPHSWIDDHGTYGTGLYHNFTFTQVATRMHIQIPIQVWWYDLLD